MGRRYFGTDGVRARVGEGAMTPDFVMRLGWAAGRVLGNGSRAPVLIGKDTRRSGYLFESALEAGFAAAGMDVALLGPLPTPGVAYLTRALGAAAGVVISASHNPHEDNGVKFFSAAGDKLNDEIESAIEAMVDQPLECVEPARVGAAQRVSDAQARYTDFCADSYSGPSLHGMQVVLDCANGAAYQVAPQVLARLGMRLSTIGVAPDGFNINLRCGSTHLEALQERVISTGAELGIALDGDGDRCLMVDGNGQLVDGDQMLFLLARHRHATGTLRGPVVGTLMSNLALEQALVDLGIAFHRAKVGDRYVLERLQSEGGELGGENSGHLLCLDKNTTGDGLISALQLLEVVRSSGKSLAQLAAEIPLYPQVMVNIRAGTDAAALCQDARVRQAVSEAEAQLGSSGRVLLRPSGTEPLIRVMVEAQEAAVARTQADHIAAAVRQQAQAA
ncbi:phosphoglucosamine mutase [Algiphilus sp.]|uniref:phosphoglucosamine mutase n=1 Tax=Algiphilus sp. TaxID=1872431 RepID=UPI003B52E72E